ncbi:MAG: diguanylate cyclase, partial [Gammaproteobacteria bacterium]|nr:diguanylate cyclase [Gammaproteobacteria bacterium]
EFIILTPETDLNGAFIHAERLRSDIEKYQFNTAGYITSSFGVTEFNSETDDIEKLLDRADKALYLAKENGRNRVEKV